MPGSKLENSKPLMFCKQVSLPMNDMKEPHHGIENKDHFYNMYMNFLEEVPLAKIWPHTGTLCLEKAIDLYKLSRTVEMQGGFDLVSSNEMWSIVSRELGFDPKRGHSLKIVYSKYLIPFVEWLQKADNLAEDGLNLDHQHTNINERTSPFLLSECDRRIGEISTLNEKGQLQDPKVKGDEECTASEIIRQEAYADRLMTANSKRKHGDSLGILQWIEDVAKNPHGTVSMKGQANFQETLVQANELRKLLFLPSAIFRNPPQKKPKAHPSLYETPAPNGEFPMNLRSSELQNSSNHLRSSEQQNSSNQPKSLSPSPPSSSSAGTSTEPAKQSDCVSGSSTLKLSPRTNFILFLQRKRKTTIHVSLSRQAVIPPLETPLEQYKVSFMASQVGEDSLLGTVVWSPNENLKATAELQIGKGRSDNCACQDPGSIECVRFHIAREREKLFAQLGPLFFIWGFNKMGEIVSRSWSQEEERLFRSLVRLNPLSQGKNFWEELPTAFPFKTREMCVSYYFNVFVLRRRSIQNRLVEEQIDSDDDEANYCLVDTLAMHKASPNIKSPDSNGSRYPLSASETHKHETKQDDYDVCGLCQENRQCDITITDA